MPNKINGIKRPFIQTVISIEKRRVMSGDVTTKSGEYWSAAGWVFREIMKETSNMLLDTDNPTLQQLLIDEDDYIRATESVELKHFETKDYHDFIAALYKAYESCETKGSKDWNQPEFYSGFMIQFKKLVELMKKD